MSYQLEQNDLVNELKIERSLSIYEAAEFSYVLSQAAESQLGLRIKVFPEVCLDTAIIQLILFYSKLAAKNEVDFKLSISDQGLFEDLQLVGVQPGVMELEA